MKLMSIKRKAQTALATATVAVLSSPVMAETSLLDGVKTEISGLKAEVLALGAVIVGISIAFAFIRVGKRGANTV